MASSKKLRKQQAVDERNQRAASPQGQASFPSRERNRRFYELAREAAKIKRAERPDPLA